MAKIRYFNFFDIFKLNKLVSHISGENIYNCFSEVVKFPCTLLNIVLPLGLKFREEAYIASHKGDLKAFLSIKPRRHNHHKWKIKKLLLDENAYEIGEQLVDFVVARYGALGVETLEVNIKNSDAPMISLFSKSCGFRYCMDYQIYRLSISKVHVDGCLSDCFFRPYKSSDKQNVADLYNYNILPYYKFPLSCHPNEFDEPLFSGLHRTSVKKYVLEDKYSNQIRGYVLIETTDNRNFIIEVVLLQSYEIYYEYAIKFAISQIQKRSSSFWVFVRNNKFHQNSQDFELKLKGLKAQLVQTEMIFVKDFFKQIKEDNRIVKPAIIYNEFKGKPAFKN